MDERNDRNIEILLEFIMVCSATAFYMLVFDEYIFVFILAIGLSVLLIIATIMVAIYVKRRREEKNELSKITQ